MLPSRPLTAVLCIVWSIFAAGCASESSIKPAEAFDERSGLTVGSLEKPIELIQSVQFAAAPDRHVSFAYLGPVEWDNMGTVSYGLWVHLAPANDWQFNDIRAPGAVHLLLDDGAAALKVIDAPRVGRAPYQPVASWGQTAYFELDVPTLRRMASSERIELDFTAAGDTAVRFNAARDAHETVMRYVQARGLAE
jgi:hypothetical protein